MDICWKKVYILGYDHPTRGSMLTTWYDNGTPMITVVITGTDKPPIWYNPVPKGAQIHEVPEGKDGKEYAEELNGIRAFGWYLEKGFKRTESNV